MQLKRAIYVVAGWIMVCSILFLFIQLSRQPQLEQCRTGLREKAAAIRDNLLSFIVTDRVKPVTTIELDEQLKLSLPQPFADFSEQDWKWFWQILYGKFTMDSSSWPHGVRQLDRSEAENMLSHYYPQPFSTFKDAQWQVFWQQILQKKVF